MRTKKKNRAARPAFCKPSKLGLERLESKRLLAADFMVQTSGNDVYVEAIGTDGVDTFELKHISQNELQVTINFTGDNGNPDTLVGVFDIDNLEVQAALAGKNFTGIVVNALGGNDTIDASALKNYDDGQITLNGGDGNDTIIGGKRGDVINGGDGDDDIMNVDNRDVVSGGAGNDSADYGGHSGAAQDDDNPLDDLEYIDGTKFDDVIDQSNNSNNVTINGRGGDDTLTGGSGNDTINGNGGEDVLTGNDGDDTLSGGADNDKLYGDAGEDLLLGGGGNDELYGGADNDELRGGAGDDDLYGEGGDDLLIGNAGNDDLRGGDGDDDVRGGDGNDTIYGDFGADRIRGGAGTDTLDHSLSPAAVEVNLKNETSGGAGSFAEGDNLVNNQIENLIGSAFNDTLAGSDDANIIDGGDGDDTINGLGGNDTINAGAGNDIVDGDDGDDTISGGTGDDQLTGSAGDDTIFGNAGNDIIEGDDFDDIVDVPLNRFDAGDNYDSGNDVLHGGDGDDVIYAASKEDVAANVAGYGAAAMTDILYGNNGNDVLVGHRGVDQLIGDPGTNPNGGDDILLGLAGDDLLYGGNGSDALIGGAGTDILNGGTGFLDGDDVLVSDQSGGAFNDLALFTGSGADRIIAVQSGGGTVSPIHETQLQNKLDLNLVFTDYNSSIDIFDAQSESEFDAAFAGLESVIDGLSALNIDVDSADVFA